MARMLVTTVDGFAFRVEPTPGKDLNQQAWTILREGTTRPTEEGFEVYPAHRIAKVEVRTAS